MPQDEEVKITIRMKPEIYDVVKNVQETFSAEASDISLNETINLMLKWSQDVALKKIKAMKKIRS